MIAWAESDESKDARTQPQGKKLPPQLVVAVEAMIAVGLFLAYVANGDGTGVAVSDKTVATALEVSESTVGRARRALRAGGFEVLLVEGGRLFASERAEAAATHGGHQWKCGSTTALTHPPTRTSEPLPRRGSTGRRTSPLRGVHKRGSAAAGTKRTPPRSRKPVPLGAQRLAACLVDREAAPRDAHGSPIALTALDPRWRGGHIGQVVTALARLAPHMRAAGLDPEPASLDAARETVADLIAVRSWWAQQLEGHAPPPSSRNALGEFVAAMRVALYAAAADGFEPPAAYRRRVEADAAARRWQQERAYALAQAERARLAADPETEAAYQAFRASLPPRLPQPPRSERRPHGRA